MGNKLPDQSSIMSPELQRLLKQAKHECKRSILFSDTPRRGYLGRTEWRDDDILVEIESDLSTSMAEYITAHELCHVLQLARGCAIASGRPDEPGAVTIASKITDFVMDPLADSMSLGFGINMAPSFKTWLDSEHFLDIMKKRKNGRRYGTNWQIIWEALTATRVCRQLGLQPPKPPKEFYTLYVSLDIGKLVQRASNLGLSIGTEILEGTKNVTKLARVVQGLISISTAKNIEESTIKLLQILDYFDTPSGHIVINKPFTGEFLIEGNWQARPSEHRLVYNEGFLAGHIEEVNHGKQKDQKS